MTVDIFQKLSGPRPDPVFEITSASSIIVIFVLQYSAIYYFNKIPP